MVSSGDPDDDVRSVLLGPFRPSLKSGFERRLVALPRVRVIM